MSIKPICDKCGQELTKYGALLFSPPNADSQVTKFHLCQTCYQQIIEDIPKSSPDAQP